MWTVKVNLPCYLFSYGIQEAGAQLRAINRG